MSLGTNTAIETSLPKTLQAFPHAPRQRRPPQATPPTLTELAVIRIEKAGNSGARLVQSSSVLTSVASHLILLLLMALCYLPLRSARDNEVLLSVADSENALLEEMAFQTPSLQLDSLASQIVDQDASQDDTPIVAAPALANIFFSDGVYSSAAAFSDEDGGIGKQSGLLSPIDVGDTGRQNGGQDHDYGTSFFGVSANGQKFVYVLDMSTSMGERTRYGNTRFQVAAQELIRCVDALKSDQEFYVILFCYRTLFFSTDNSSAPTLVKATAANKRLLKDWLSQVRLNSGTDPRLGVLTALRLQPDAIFLLSDGELNGQRRNLHRIPGNPPLETIIAANRVGTPIHTIAFEDEGNRERLRRVAEHTDGTHRFVQN